jgi:hypothetical protein
MHAPKEFKLRLLNFLNNIYRQNWIPDEWRNAVITPIFKNGDRKEPQAFEDGPDRGFRNIGQYKPDAGDTPKN